MERADKKIDGFVTTNRRIHWHTLFTLMLNIYKITGTISINLVNI